MSVSIHLDPHVWDPVAISLCIFVAIVCGIGLMKHVWNFYWSSVQKCYGRMLLFAVFYSLLSLLSYFIPHRAGAVEFLKAIIESYAVVSFYAALIFYLGGEIAILRIYTRDHHDTDNGNQKYDHDTTNTASTNLFFVQKYCVYQILLIRPLLVFLESLIIYLYGPELPSHINVMFQVFKYFAMISLMIAVIAIITTARKVQKYCEEELHTYRMHMKFIVFKTVVVLGMIESIAVMHLLESHYFEIDAPSYTKEQTGARFVSLLSILQLALFSIAFYFAYSYIDVALLKRHGYVYEEHGVPNAVESPLEAIVSILSVWDYFTVEDGKLQEKEHESKTSYNRDSQTQPLLS